MNTCRCCHFLIPAFLQSSRSIFVRHCYSCGVYQLSCCCCVCLLPRSCSCKVDSTISRNYDQFSNFRVMCVCVRVRVQAPKVGHSIPVVSCCLLSVLCGGSVRVPSRIARHGTWYMDGWKESGEVRVENGVCGFTPLSVVSDPINGIQTGGSRNSNRPQAPGPLE